MQGKAWVAALLILAAVLVVGVIVTARRGPKQGLPPQKLDSWHQEEQFPGPRPALQKTQHGPPASLAAMPPQRLGLLPADVGPVPLQSRRFTVSNKWMGEVDGALLAVYAGAETGNPQQGFIAVFRPEAPAAAKLRVYRMPSAQGSLQITAVQDGTVRFTCAGGSGSFDLHGMRFGD